MLMFMRYLLLSTPLLSSVLALPLASREVVDPPITSPKAGAVWHVGETQTVTWSATGLPVNIANPVGMLVLGHLGNNSENLMLDSPLATNISYSVGRAQIMVPNVPTRSDYIIVLFGDSGNASPQFTIINDTSSSTSVTSSSAPTTTPPDSASSVVPTPDSTPSLARLNSGSTSSVTPTPDSTPSPSKLNSDSTSSVTPTPGSTPSPAKLSSSGSDGSSQKPTSRMSATTASSQTASRTSTTGVITSSTTPPSTQSNAASLSRIPSLCISFSIAFSIYSTFS